MENMESDSGDSENKLLTDSRLLKLIVLAAVIVAVATAGAFFVVFQKLDKQQNRWDCTVKTLVAEEEQCVPMDETIKVILNDLREIKNP